MLFDPDTKEVFKERIKEKRLEQGLSQTELSRMLNISRQAYSHYETGEREPNNENLAMIARSLKVSTDYLLGITDFHDFVNEYLCEVLSNFSFGKSRSFMTPAGVISSIENGTYTFTHKSLDYICKDLNINKDELLDDAMARFKKYQSALKTKDNAINLSEHEKKVMIAYRQNPEMQSAVDKLLGIESAPDLSKTKFA